MKMGRRLDQADIEGMIGNFGLDGFRICHRQPRLNLGIARLEIPQHARQHVFRNGRTGADQQSAPDFPGHFGQPGFHFRGQVQNPLGIPHRQVASQGEGDLAVAALEQSGIEVLLELLDLKSHRRLRHEQYLRRLGETQLFGYSIKNLKSAVCHRESIRKFNDPNIQSYFGAQG